MHIASGVMFVLIGLVLLVNVARKAPAEPAAATARPPSDRAAATPARGPVFGLIVRQALRFEEDIARFFTDLAADLPEGSSASPALLRLAEEERAHSQSLTKVAELASDGAASAALNEALATVALGSPELTLPSWTGNEDRPQGEPTAGQMTPSEASALRAALKAEEGAAAFYLALSRQSPLPVVQDAFRWLAMEEIRHSQHLTALLRATVEGSGSA